MSRLDVDAVVFDVLGTMVDEPGGIERGVRALVPDRDDPCVGELVRTWRAYVDEQQREILAGRRPYAASTVVDSEAARCVAAAAGVEDADAVRALAAEARRLEPWPDSIRGLDRIASHRRVAGLSNASRSALIQLSAYAGLRWHRMLSAEDARSYKPRPEVYRLAVADAGVSPDRLLMVAAHAWDLRGAQAVGMRTAYVVRPVGDPPRATDAFDVYAEGLDDLALQLEAA